MYTGKRFDNAYGNGVMVDSKLVINFPVQQANCATLLKGEELPEITFGRA